MGVVQNHFYRSLKEITQRKNILNFIVELWRS